MDIKLGMPKFELEGNVLPNEVVCGGKGFSISSFLSDSNKWGIGLNISLVDHVCPIQLWPNQWVQAYGKRICERAIEPYMIKGPTT